MYLIKDLYSEYIKNHYDSITKRKTIRPQVGDGDCLTGGRRRVVDWVLQSSWGSLTVTPVIPGQPAGEGPRAAAFHSRHLCGFQPSDPGSPRQGLPQLWASCLHL